MGAVLCVSGVRNGPWTLEGSWSCKLRYCKAAKLAQLPQLCLILVSHLNCHFFPQFGQARTPSRAAAKPPRPGYRERNKENVSQLNGTTLSGGCTPTVPAQRNHSVNSVASTYSEFAVIHLF